MKYVLKIWLYGGLASDYLQPLSNVTVCLHSFCSEKNTCDNQEDEGSKHVAQSAEPAIWNNLPVAKGITDEQGRCCLVLHAEYAGGALDAGILVTKPRRNDERLIYMTTMTPLWQKHDDVYVGAWCYCLMPQPNEKIDPCPAADYPGGSSFAEKGRQIRTSVPTPGVE